MAKYKKSFVPIDLNQLRKEKKIENFRNKAINYRATYSEEDQNNQIEILKVAFNEIKKRKNEHQSTEEIKCDACLYLVDLIDSIKTPTLDDFYLSKTFENMYNLKLTPYIEEIIEKELYTCDLTYKNASPNLSQNYTDLIIFLMNDMLRYCQDTIYILEDDLKDIIEKIENQNLKLEDAEKLEKYVKSYILHIKTLDEQSWKNFLKNDYEIVIRELYKNKDELLEYVEINNGKENKKINIEDLECEFNNNRVKENYVNGYWRTKMVKGNPFLGNNKKNNILIFLRNILEDISQQKHFENMYQYICSSYEADSPEQRNFCKGKILDILKNMNFISNKIDIRLELIKRISIIIDFLDRYGEFHKFNSINNNRFAEVNENQLTLEDDEVLSKFISQDSRELYKEYRKIKEKNGDRMNTRADCQREHFFVYAYNGTCIESNSTSTGQIIAMSAFYTNRLTKIMRPYKRLSYLLKKYNVVEKIFDNPDISFEDLNIDNKSLIDYMAWFDALEKQVLKLDLKQEGLIDIKQQYRDAIYQQAEDEFRQQEISNKQEIFQLKNDINAKLAEYMKSGLLDYKDSYNSGFKNSRLNLKMEKDIEDVMYGLSIVNDLYDLKFFSISTLLYTAINDKNKSIFNWGIVLEDDEIENLEKTDNKKILLAFDIRGLNMSAYFHAYEKDIIKLLLDLTGKKQIQVYEGACDLIIYGKKDGQSKRYSTQILYPVSKKQKKEIINSSNKSTWYNHIRWLQEPIKRPVYIKAPGSRVYDFETGKIKKVLDKEQKDR